MFVGNYCALRFDKKAPDSDLFKEHFQLLKSKLGSLMKRIPT